MVWLASLLVHGNCSQWSGDAGDDLLTLSVMEEWQKEMRSKGLFKSRKTWLFVLWFLMLLVVYIHTFTTSTYICAYFVKQIHVRQAVNLKHLKKISCNNFLPHGFETINNTVVGNLAKIDEYYLRGASFVCRHQTGWLQWFLLLVS